MFYHLSNTVKISSTAYGAFNGLFNVAICRRCLPMVSRAGARRIKHLLFWETIIAIAQGPIMFFAQAT